MRLSVFDDPVFVTKMAIVTLDGIKQERCQIADEEAGECVVIVGKEDGLVIREVRKGKVEISFG